MAKLRQTTPVILRLEDLTPKDLVSLRGTLAYKDQKIVYEYTKLKNNKWLRAKDPEGYTDRLEALKASINKTLLFEDDQGYWTFAGLRQRLEGLLTPVEFIQEVQYPDSGFLGYENKPPFEPYPYQQQSLEKLLEVKHGGVELATGLGKTYIAQMLSKELGLKTVIMCPLADIARKFHEECVQLFGRRYVGLYGDGSKEYKKLITICVGASLSKLDDPDAPIFKEFAKTKVFIADESHLCPAKTLEKVCHKLFANTPYRFFFSGTQVRNDGLDILLEAITGPLVHRMSVKEGVEKGYLAPLQFSMVQMDSGSRYEDRDPQELTRAHLYYSTKVNKTVGDLVHHFTGNQGLRVLILVDEMEQFGQLLPYFRAEARFAHGGVTKENKDKVPQAHWKSDPTALVKSFNAGEFPILVGTSCIATGTNICANDVTIYLRGGKSEIECFQGAVGRSTRWSKITNKIGCHIIDLDIVNVEAVHRHALVRKSLYETVAPVRILKM